MGITVSISTPPPDMNETLAEALLNDTLSVREYLELTRGPKHLSPWVVVPITVVYSVIFVTGVLGNVAVCAVIVRSPSMRTTTNYYLFSLAISDLILLLLGLPNEVSVYWQQYPWVLGTGVCKLRALVSEMSSYVSVLTIVAFSLERYLAICYPIYSYTMKGLHSALGIIAVLWMIAFVSAVPFAYYTTVDYVEYPPGSGAPLEESAFCAMLMHNLPAGYPLCELSSVFFFVLPMTVMLVLYTRMARVIWRPRAVPRGSVRKDHNRKPIVRMLAAVVLAFFISWAPFHMQRLMYIYGRDAPNFEEINEVMYYVTGCFYYFSATINPILYNVMSAKYRNAFLQTLCGRQKSRPSGRGEQSSFRENTVVGYDGSVSRASTTRYSVCRGTAAAGDRGSLKALAALYK
ncbi:neuropeptides capa receptor-like [Schistocerca serialis cubense]|uniref:neuropeptides capa receptor-like n=1 Tax=Schistocerca serialis cubense TaxID=2023355 RepID=UPI00214F45F4|nr:neuropeptides capa receptor-like [Schistocerca serialis cubense]